MQKTGKFNIPYADSGIMFSSNREISKFLPRCSCCQVLEVSLLRISLTQVLHPAINIATALVHNHYIKPLLEIQFMPGSYIQEQLMSQLSLSVFLLIIIQIICKESQEVQHNRTSSNQVLLLYLISLLSIQKYKYF